MQPLWRISFISLASGSAALLLLWISSVMAVEAHHCHVYVASPYGFAKSTEAFMRNQFYRAIEKGGCTVIDPWRYDPANLPLPMELGKLNAQDIDKADGVIAALDGVDVDSGTAAEIGYASAFRKRIIGYRGDFRRSGEHPSVKVNLQVEYFIRANGGTIVETLEGLTNEVNKRFIQHQ